MGETFSQPKLSPRDISVHIYRDSSWVEFYWDFAATLKKDSSPVTTHGRETWAGLARHVLYLHPEWPSTNRSSREIKELRRSHFCAMPDFLSLSASLFGSSVCLLLTTCLAMAPRVLGGLIWRQDESIILAGNRSRCGCTARMGHNRLWEEP